MNRERLALLLADSIQKLEAKLKRFVVIKMAPHCFAVHREGCRCKSKDGVRITAYANDVAEAVRSEERHTEGVFTLAKCLNKEKRTMPKPGIATVTKLATAKKTGSAPTTNAPKPSSAPAPKAVKPPKKPRANLAEKFGGKKITVLTKENPKRGKSAERFAHYKTGMTTDQAVAKGATWPDIEWDQRDHHHYLNAKGERVKGPYIKLS